MKKFILTFFILLLIMPSFVSGLETDYYNDKIETKKTDFRYLVLKDKSINGIDQVLHSDTTTVKNGEIIHFHLSSQIYEESYLPWLSNGNSIEISIGSNELPENDTLYGILMDLFFPILIFPVKNINGDNRFELWKQELGEFGVSRLGRFIVSQETITTIGSDTIKVQDIKKYNQHTGVLQTWKYIYNGEKIFHIQIIKPEILLIYGIVIFAIITTILTYFMWMKLKQRSKNETNETESPYKIDNSNNG